MKTYLEELENPLQARIEEFLEKLLGKCQRTYFGVISAECAGKIFREVPEASLKKNWKKPLRNDLINNPWMNFL